MHGPSFYPFLGREWMSIAWTFSTRSCIQHLECRQSMTMTAAFPTIPSLSSSLSPPSLQYRATTPSNSLPGIYVVFLHTSPVHDPFILYLSPSLGFHIYILSLPLPSYNFPSFTCVLDDTQSVYLVHFTCFSFLGSSLVFPVCSSSL